MHPVDLYAAVLRAVVARAGVDPALIEDVITGCVIQVAEQSGNIGRQAALAAGLPESVPAVTLDRKCGSAQQAFDFAAQGVIAGAYDCVIAGGVEMMSLVPMKLNRMGRDNEGPLFHRRYPDGLVRQGISAELIAARWSIERAEMDTFALASHRRAVFAEDAGIVQRAIVPVEAPRPAGDPQRVRTRRRPAPRHLAREARVAAPRLRRPDGGGPVSRDPLERHRRQFEPGHRRRCGRADRRRGLRAAARLEAARGDHPFRARRRRPDLDADRDHSGDPQAARARGAQRREASTPSRSTKRSRPSCWPGCAIPAPIRSG